MCGELSAWRNNECSIRYLFIEKKKKINKILNRIDRCVRRCSRKRIAATYDEPDCALTAATLQTPTSSHVSRRRRCLHDAAALSERLRISGHASKFRVFARVATVVGSVASAFFVAWVRRHKS